MCDPSHKYAFLVGYQFVTLILEARRARRRLLTGDIFTVYPKWLWFLQSRAVHCILQLMT